MIRPALAILAAVSLAGPALAQPAPAPAAPAAARPPPPPPAVGPSMALALEAAQVAVATCTANGYKVAATVLDSAGVLKVVLVGDGVGPGAVGSSTRKGNAVLKYKAPSAELQAKAAADPAFAATVAADTTLFARAGAQPIMSKGQIIGALGVGGAPGGDKDDVCTSAGLAKIKDRL